MKCLVLLLALCGISLGVSITCVETIARGLYYLKFNSTKSTSYYVKVCSNTVIVRSLWASAKTYCTAEEIETGSEDLAGECETEVGVQLTPYSEVLPTLTQSYISSLPVAEFSDVVEKTKFHTSVLISRNLYEITKDTYVTWESAAVLRKRYSWAIYGFWGGVLLVAIIDRFLTHIYGSRQLKSSTDPEAIQSQASLTRRRSKPVSLIDSAYSWFRSNLVVPAAFGSHHSRPIFWSTVPTRLETIVVSAFWIMIIILCCVGYDIFYPNLYYTKGEQGWRYVADRTGVFSYAILPWLWLFAGRNNIFLWLTGWSYTTFNVYHRHIARCATVLAVVHSICYSMLYADRRVFASAWKERYWYTGVVATITMSLMLLFSFLWFRANFYETFLLMHIGLGVITLVCLYYHTLIYDGEYNPYLWAPIALWVFDRVARVIRWAYCNIHLRSSGSIIKTKAWASYIKDGEFIRIEIVPGSRLLRPRPGQHYFLYQPLTWTGWENHPFTLAKFDIIEEPEVDTTVGSRLDSISDTTDNSSKEIQAAEAVLPPAATSTTDPRSSHRAPSIFQHSAGQLKLTFLVRPVGNWTKRLRDRCLKSPTGAITPTIFIEGPYGEHSPLHTYENVVLVVGGSGISGALPYLHEHIKLTASRSRAPNATSSSTTATLTKDITFIWSTKQASMISDIATHELKPALARDDIHIHLYATSHEDVRRSVETTIKESDDGHRNSEKITDASPSRHIVPEKLGIKYHRPNIRESIWKVINDVNVAGTAGGRIAILTCGPAGMADEARAAVHTALKQGKRGVEYFEETFGW